MTTIGKSLIFPVWINVAASNMPKKVDISKSCKYKVLNQTYFTLLYILTDQNFGIALHLTKECKA